MTTPKEDLALFQRLTELVELANRKYDPYTTAFVMQQATNVALLKCPGASIETVAKFLRACADALVLGQALPTPKDLN